MPEGWPQWRGANRDGHGRGLPKQWTEPKRLWRFDLPSQGLGGVAANDELVVVSSRDHGDTQDIFFVLDAPTGTLVTRLQYDAPGVLDYGSSVRATPILTTESIYVQGAFGHVHCIDAITGEIQWKKHLVEDLGGILPIWGYCASPLLIDGRLIVQPGGPRNSIAALDAKSGNVIWASPGRKAAYASPVFADIASMKQVIAFDDETLGGWSISDGRRLWELKPAVDGDFNVPTPVLIRDQVVIVSENNATRVHSIASSGAIATEPFAKSDALAGDSHSPVAMGDWLVGIDGELVVLDTKNGLKTLCTFADKSLSKYCSLIVDDDRILVACENGTMILLTISSDSVQELGRFSSLDDGGELLAHPALVDGVLYVRGTKWIDAYRWK